MILTNFDFASVNFCLSSLKRQSNKRESSLKFLVWRSCLPAHHNILFSISKIHNQKYFNFVNVKSSKDGHYIKWWFEKTYICSDSTHLNPLWRYFSSSSLSPQSCFQAAAWRLGVTTWPRRAAPCSATPSWGRGPGQGPGSPGTGCSSTRASTGAPTSPLTGSSR